MLRQDGSKTRPNFYTNDADLLYWMEFEGPVAQRLEQQTHNSFDPTHALFEPICKWFSIFGAYLGLVAG